MKRLTAYEKGFLEGAIDTDGSITLWKDRRRKGKRGKHVPKRGYSPELRLSIANNNKRFLEKFKKTLDDGGTIVPKKRGKSWEYRAHHKVMKWVLPQISLIVKEKRRVLALKILEIIEVGKNQYTNTAEQEEKLTALVEEFLKA